MDLNQNPKGRSNRPQKKLRSACDLCHQTKVRCSGDAPCQTCENIEMECVYSVSNRVGRPPGIKNRKTLDHLSKGGASESQKQSDRGSMEEDLMSESNGAVQDVFDRGIMHSDLSQLQTQLGASQPGGPLPSVPPSTGLSPGINTLNIAFPASDDPFLTAFDPTAPWPTFSDLVGIPTTGNTVANQGYAARSPSPTVYATPLDMAAFAQSGSSRSPLHHTTPPISSTTSSDSSSTFRQQMRYFDPATASHSRLMQDPAARIPTPSGKGNAKPASTGEKRLSRASYTASCECLERHADLLLRLKDLQAQQNERIDILLVFAKRGIEAWRSLIDCAHCQENDDQEVLMLTAMSIRIFVRSLRRLNFNNDRNLASESTQFDSQSSTGIRNCLQINDSDNSSGSTRGNRALDYRYGPAAAKSGGTSTHSPPVNISSARTNLGMFEITGMDRTIVMKVMLSRTLQQIQIVLVGLKQRAGSEQRWRRPSGGAQRLQYRRPLDLEQVRQLGLIGDENDEAVDFWGEAEGEDDEDDHMGFVVGLLNGLETMVLSVRRDLQAELNPALDSGGGATFY